MKTFSRRLLPVVFFLGLSSCAHQEPAPPAAEPAAVVAPAKVEYAYGGRCAASVKANRFNVQGDPKFNLEHAGKTYCFSSAKARDDFNRDLAKNVAAAERNWARRAETIR